MADFKYVMFTDEETGQQIPVLFPNAVVHVDAAMGFRSALRKSMPKGKWKVESAGFVNVAVTSTFGRSDSINIASKSEDRVTINVHPICHGVKTGMESMVEPMALIKVIEKLMEVARG